MTKGPAKKRRTFRHGSLPAALVETALARLETKGPESLSLRDLARAAGVNHRAVYRHFPGKLSLVAGVAQEGWRRLAAELSRKDAARKRGEAALVAHALALYRFARGNPNLFNLMAGPRINLQGAFPDLDRTVTATAQLFARGFVEAGLAPKLAVARATVFVSALTGVIQQILYQRLRLKPSEAQDFIADTAKRLLKGLI